MITLGVVAFVLALKSVLHRRGAGIKSANNGEESGQGSDLFGEEDDLVYSKGGSSEFVRGYLNKESLGCEKISTEEFEMQGLLTTQREVHKLINSEKYQ